MDGHAELSVDDTGRVESDPIFHIFEETLRYSREREYIGWDKVDGLSSRFAKALPADNKWPHIFVQETVKRAPINLRPYLLVEQRRNCKGASLFAMANLDAYAITGERRYATEARDLLDWLIDQDLEGFAGFCGGGHRHPMIQSLDREEVTDPDESTGVVSLSYTVAALLRYAAAFGHEEYAATARDAITFIEEELDLSPCEEGLRLKYMTHHDNKSYTLNANALAARLYIDLYGYFEQDQFRETATAILEYVASKQTATGGWMYMDPPTASSLSMDNYHNGFIIDSFQRYRAVTGSDRFSGTLDRGLSFYRNRLFEDDGAPNWDESSSYPRDINAAAEGIIVFAREADFEFARRILEWTIDSLYAGDGQFYYQKRRFYTKQFTLMRWCQAWMAYALSTYLTERYDVTA